jgi:lambda family phage portal protein
MPAQVFRLEDPAKPLKGSRVLAEFNATRQRERQQLAAEREMRQAMQTFRRHNGPATVRRPVAAFAQDLPQPAFGQISGQRAFAAAATDRVTAGWTTAGTGINADLEAALGAMRARSRDWCVNTDIGRRYISLVQDNVVGNDVPRLQVRAMLSDGKTLDEVANTAVETAWWQWCQRGSCEVTGQLSFADLCRAVIAADARDGEHLVRRLRSSSLPMGYQLQLLDVDRILLTSAAGQAGRNTVRMGVEIDKLGRKVALHLHSNHPGDSAGLPPQGAVADRLEASQVFHDFLVERPEQLRGYPWTAAVLKSANQLATYKTYALVAAKIGAAKMGFYVTDKEAPSGEAPSFEDYKDATGQLVQDVEAGMIEALPPGTTFETFDPDYPHQAFESFVLGHERGIAAGLNVAHHNLSGNMTGVNYSSARIAELAERSHWRGLQRWFIDAFVRPVFNEWLQMALLSGAITLPSGARLPADRFAKFAQAAAFQPRSWAWVDPKNDAETAVLMLSNDMRSLRQINDEQSVDLEEVLADKKRLVERYRADGLPLPAWLADVQAQSAAAQQPNTDPNTGATA